MEDESGPHLVKISELTIHDANDRLLSSGNLSIKSGRTLALFGPGGSGKSLLLKFLYGIRPEGLSYEFENYDTLPGLTFFLDRNKDKSSPANIPDQLFDLYLIDEPENGYSLEYFNEFYQKIRKENATLIFVTHHLGFLESFADEIMVMKYGENKGVFTKHDFFNNDDPYIDYLSKMGC